MYEKSISMVLPILMVILMLASSFAVMGEVSGAEMPTQTRAYGSEGKILYIYGNNKTLADDWRSYLISLNYSVDLLPQNGLKNAEYKNYNMVIVGTDAIYIPSKEALNMYRSNVPIIGTGYGGGRFAPVLGMTAHFYYGNTHTYEISALNLSIYHTPSEVSGVPGNIQLYNTLGDGIYLITKSDRNSNDTLFFGNWTGDSTYSPMAQINNYLFYGYTQSPKELTNEGNTLMKNIIYYMDKNHGYNVYIPRMISRITMDGKFTNIFEWYGAHFIKLDDTWDNYTGIFEDENYIYLYLQVVNTSSNYDYLSVHFESNNSRNSTQQQSTFYVLLSESSGGVLYRDVGASGSWSSFKHPDGVNITAYWVFGSQYCTAEVKLLKSYMGLDKNGDNLLGFGMQYTNITNYPSTLNFRNPSTYLTAYSQYHWKGQYEEISTPSSYISPIIDGKMNADEWNGASQYYLQDKTSNIIYIRSMADGSYLYLGGYLTNFSGKESTIRFYFDPNGDGGSAPQTDDIRFWGSKLSNDTLIAKESHGTGSGWSIGEAPTNATIKLTMRGSYVYYEMKIPLNVLGITSGTFRDVHMRVHTYINGYGYTVPYDSDYLKPDEWTLLLTSPSAWGNNNMTFDAHNGTAVTIDGNMSGGEWDDAFHCTYPVSNTLKNLDMYMKTSGDKLYILAHYLNPTPSNNTNIQLGFDVDYNHDGSPKSGDFAIKIAFNGDIKEWHVSGGNWVYATPSGWSFAMNNSTSSWTIEIAIDYSKLNIITGNAKDIGVIVYMVDDGAGAQNEPTDGSWFDTSTWSRITSSDNWGESTEVPEFSDGLLAMMLIVVFVAVAVVARKRR